MWLLYLKIKGKSLILTLQVAQSMGWLLKLWVVGKECHFMSSSINKAILSTEREKPLSLTLERQREALSKGADVAWERGRDETRAREQGAIAAEPAAPSVGRWGAEWPSWLSPDADRHLTRQPLPRARWGPPARALPLSPTDHEALVTRAEAVLRRLLVSDNYDSVTNFVGLYDAFTKSEQPLYDVYEGYTPPIRNKKHTCVGLGLELMKRWRGLERQFPGFGEATSLISCEEAVQDVREYVCAGEGPVSVEMAEKEHVMIGVQVRVDGRPGTLLADPGYHVPRIITIMADGNYPHTGKFITKLT